jgi:phytoene dehydrogenase-like protein
MKYDVIIIGSGLGGLTAGAKLAREGRKVLLVEQHNRPGGCATTFRRGDFTFEVGLHEMDGPSARDMKTRIFNDLDVSGKVEFVRVPEFYRFINDRYSVTVSHDPQVTIKTLTDLFPGETVGLAAFFDQILNPKKRSSGNDFQDKSVGEFLDSIIHNEDLKFILLGNLGYFHDDPYSLSLAYYSIAQGSYFTNGASFIKGGSQMLSDHLAGFIRTHEGEVALNHIVTGIITDGARATGARFKKKNSSTSEYIEAYADEIVANNAIPNLCDLLPIDLGKALRKELGELRPGASLFTLYLGFNRSLKETGHSDYSTFIFDGSVKSQADILKNNHDDFKKRSFTFTDYSQIDSGLAPAGKSVAEVCCIDYPEDWEKLDKKDYDLKKENVCRAFIERLEKIIPGISNIIEYYEAGTSLTVRRYTLNPGGAVYGFAQTPGRKFIDSFKNIENLHFASAWGRTGGGFSGVIMGGYLCALNILRRKRSIN